MQDPESPDGSRRDFRVAGAFDHAGAASVVALVDGRIGGVTRIGRILNVQPRITSNPDFQIGLGDKASLFVAIALRMSYEPQRPVKAWGGSYLPPQSCLTDDLFRIRGTRWKRSRRS